MAHPSGFTAPTNPPKCRKCSTDMQPDTRIEPVGNLESLTLYTCETCGASESMILSATNASDAE